MSQFQKIGSNTPAFAEAHALFESMQDRFDYDGLANAYNDCTPGEMVKFNYKKGKASVVSQQLARRGLAKGVDFTVRSAAIEGNDAESLVFVLRNTDKAAGPVVVGQRGRKPKAGTDAAGSGTAAAEAAPATPAPAKGSAKK